MEVDCVGVVSESSSGGFVVVVVLEDFGPVLWSSWRMILWCWNEREDFLVRCSLFLVAREMFVVVGACLFRIVIQYGFWIFWIFWSSWKRWGCWCGGGSLRYGVECGRWWSRRY